MRDNMDHYEMKREDFSNINPYIAGFYNEGRLWVELWLTKEEVTLLFCKGIMVRKIK